MQRAGLHIINKNTLNIEVADMDTAQKINTLARQVTQPMHKALEEALDACDMGENITIDKLYINLTFSSPDDFGRNFTAVLKQKIIQSLSSQLSFGLIKESLPEGHSPFKNSDGTDREASQAKAGDAVNNLPLKNNIHKNTVWDIFEYYLQNGVFPWWFAGNGRELAEMLQTAWPKQGTVFPAGQIFRLLQYQKKFQRFIQLIPTNRLGEWSPLLSGTGGKALYKTIQQLARKSPKNTAIQIHHWYGWVFYAAFIARYKQGTTTETIVADLKHWLQKMPGSSIYDSRFITVLDEYPDGFSGIALKKGTGINTFISKLVEEILINADKKVKKKPATIEETPEQADELSSITNDVMVANAGLVICWPFLSAAFKKLDWLEEGKFKDIHSRKQAVLFLHYLVYKTMPEDESPLYLNKLLCGLDTGEFISIHEEIGEGWQEMREGLLKAVLQQWDALKSASVEALLQTFIIRNGKVKPNPGGYHLLVERKTLDILLDRLPWPISIIKPAWNSYIISVTW